MSFSYNGYTVADIEVTGICGRVGIGVSLLCFSISFRVLKTALAGVRVRGFQLRINVENGSSQTPGFIGFAVPEVPLELETNGVGDPTRLLFELPLSEGQLFALEKLRGGHDLNLKLRFAAMAEGPKGIWPQYDEIGFTVNLSDWARVLKELHGPEYMVIGIALPTCATDHTLAEAVGRIRRAQAHLVDGRFDAVVSECRLAIESAVLAAGEQTAIANSVQQSKYAKRDMTKLDRELSLMEAVRHYTHLAHHVDARGASEYYSREDANMLLATTAALISSSMARLPNRKNCIQ